MKIAKAVRKLLKLPLTLPLQIGFIRRRVAFELKYHWFAEIDFQIPLSDGFGCPIAELDALHSFSEIFAANEYGSLLDEISLPKRWIDLGCHAGFFTLYLAWQRAVNGQKDWNALLIDADPRMREQTLKTLKLNRLESQCVLLWGLISSQPGERDFALRGGMGSSTDLSVGGVSEVRRVRTISPGEILRAFPPPYDLVKVDIEGAEYDFLENYTDVYTNASAILIEWHSSDRAGSGKDRVQELLEPRGFRLVKMVRPIRLHNLNAQWYSSGVQLYRRMVKSGVTI